MANERVVEFAVKARDEYSKVLANLAQQQSKLSAAAQTAGRRAVLGVADTDLQAAVDNYKRLTSEVVRYQAALDNGRQSGKLAAAEQKELADTIALTRNRSREAIDTINQHRTALNQMQGGAVTGYAAFDRLATSIQRQTATAQAATQAAAAGAIADEKAAAVAARKAQIQERLNTTTESGFANWQRYIDAVNRNRAADEKSAAVAALKAQIQDRLNNSATSGLAAFNRLATAIQQNSSASGADAAQLAKWTVATNTAATAQTILKKKVDATTVALNNQGGAVASPKRRGPLSPGGNGAKGESQDITAFGLKPYQLTNLGYQVNDVVSGLAMGQRPLQILAQQAGQVIQIWPNTMAVLARGIPVIAGVTAVLTPFIVSALRLRTTAESVRIFSNELALSADGSRYAAQNLALIVDKMGKVGIATDAARTMVKQFVKDGVSEKDIMPLTKMAQQLAAITGESVADAGKRVSTAFSGTIDDVRALDKELNFLTASQYAQIEAMAKAGNGAGAMARAQAILAGKLAETADKGGDWTKAVNSLSKAWDNLIVSIQKSGVLGYASRQLKLFADDVNAVAGVVVTATNAISPSTLPAQQQVDILNQQIAQQKQLAASGSIIGTTFDTADLIKQRDALLVILDTRREELQTIKDATASQKESVDLTEADKKARLDIQELLDKQGAALSLETKQAQLTNRERYIEGQLLDAKNTALAKAKELNQQILGLTAEQTKQIRDQAGLAYDSTHVNYEAQYTSRRGTPAGQQEAEVVKFAAIIADRLQLNVKDILTAISYETKGTFNPGIVGGAGNNYEGLFQAGPAARQRYGIDKNSSIEAQMNAMAKYLVDAGVKAGDGLLQIYAAINAGSAKKINASDEKNGGAPGTVLDKVSDQMGQHKDKAEGLLAAYAGIAEQAKKTQEYEKDFNARTAAAAAELDLKTKETRQAAVNKALVDETNRAKKAGVELTQQQLDLVKQQAGAEFDRAHADDQVNQLVAQRTALFQSLQIAQAAGDQGKVASTIDLIGQVEEKLNTAIPAAIAFWQAIGGSGAEQEIAKLRAIQEGIGQTLQKLDRQFLPQAQQMNERLAEIGGNAFSAFAQALANGENAMQAFFNALKQGVAEYLIEIGKAIIKQTIFNAISGGSGAGGSGGVGGTISSWITSLFHEGGVVGGPSASGSRSVNPAIFANAQRYHGGGIVDLKKGEVPIIAMKGEEMLTENDPRHTNNGGGRGQAVNLKNVNVFSAEDMLEAALQSVVGERVMINFMSRNSRKIQGAIGS
ncbi:phage tail length tape measure family protein [Mesorhizobium sp. AR07]|uniref:phage tail length tape measure family protein n=1 Tax=Mesorhizobium sp. AR07 TaxID=2865838 RepID=UPI00215DFBEF|nr:phage tail length tape measure family protein [Mesorhizobium sp. AR07]UVK46816.1 phage tail length tape measure family protein [Mesorhizobium sp. AR07]